MKARPILAGLIASWLGMEKSTHAERVRTIYLNERSIEPVYLSLGRSTVLRFDEKPKTAVIGNQNYFSIEYIGNDLSIQPLSATTTNLFIYTESRTYALILKVAPHTQYDDLIYVKAKPAYVSVKDPTKKGVQFTSERPIRRSAEIPGVAKVTLEKALQTIAGIWILEFTVENTGDAPITAKEIQMVLKDGDTPRLSTAPVFKQDSIAPGKAETGRILSRIPSLEGLSLTMNCRGKSAQVALFPDKKGRIPRSKKQ